MTDEELDEEIYEERDGDDGDGYLLALGVGAAALLLGRLSFSPSLAPSVTFPSLPNINLNTGPPQPPLPPLPPPIVPPVVAVNLPSPLRPPRGITPHGGYGAPRYKLTVPLVGTKSSAVPVYPGQPVDHQHGGIDFAAAKGEAVLAVEDGELRAADPGPFGAPGAVAVVADAPGGRRWAFVHVLPVGTLPRHVKQGDWIATVGGNHLHLQLTVGGVLTDPTGFF